MTRISPIKIILIIIFLLSSSYSTIKAQDTTRIFEKKINIKRENIPVYQALFEISNKINQNFSYNSSILDGEKIISLKYENTPLGTILDSIINDSTVQYESMGQHIILYKDKLPDKTSLSQQNRKTKQQISIKGKIFGKTDNKPLPYCNVGLEGKSIGTVSNVEGEFILKLPAESYQDTIVISYIGYKNKYIPVQKLIKEEEKILLEKMSYSIQEVIIRWSNPYKIIAEAISRINENYYLKPVHITSFYRETIMRDNDYTSFSEAIMQMHKAYNQFFQSDQIKVLKSRKNIKLEDDDNVFMKLKSGLEAILLLDIIHQDINFLSPGQFQNYIYEYKGITHFDDQEVYEIKFSPHLESNQPLYTGTIYINVKSLAIIGADFFLDEDNLKKISNSLIIKKKLNINVKPKEAKYSVNYRKFENKYFLNQIRGDLIFKVRKKNELLGKNYEVSFEMISSDIDTTQVEKFDNTEVTKPHKVFIEEINEYDPSFWGDYNYILPNEPLKETMKKMSPQLKMLQDQ